jgi:cytochrome P450
MSKGEMLNNASVLVLAGSETSATTMAGAIYFLCRHPNVLAKVNAEVRSAFASSSEITTVSVGKLEYLEAVIHETMRIYTPVPNVPQRTPPKGGAMAAGKFVPEGVCNGLMSYRRH